jgi:hypothetical protein
VMIALMAIVMVAISIVVMMLTSSIIVMGRLPRFPTCATVGNVGAVLRSARPSPRKLSIQPFPASLTSMCCNVHASHNAE